MPKVYRGMRRDGEYPQVGRDRNSLGVVTEGPNPDIFVNRDGTVAPNTGGMSVAPSWRQLPDHRIPKRLIAKRPRATGNNALVCWRLGDGDFQDEAIAPGLVLTVDNKCHGTIEPEKTMTLSTYEAALVGSRERWVEDET
jgi:hypothetical protein